MMLLLLLLLHGLMLQLLLLLLLQASEGHRRCRLVPHGCQGSHRLRYLQR